MADENLNTVAGIIQKYGQLIIDRMKDVLIQNGKDATGRLISSIRFEDIKVFGQNYSYNLIMEDYWINVKDGRGAGKKLPPEQSILDWIRDKGIKPQRLSLVGKIKTRGKNVGKPFTAQEIYKQTSFGIRKKIARDGIKPLNFIDMAVTEELKQNFKNEISSALGREITLQLKNITLEFNKPQ